ncbi:MAG: phosphoribosylamine--glycine ligase [Micavibrio sp.]|nr:phosphoribosylamine--glycine ligase [Micavibrio sp.]
MNILLIGSGGREHALAWLLKQSPRCGKLYCAPGNPGIADSAECVAIAIDDLDGIITFAKDKKIDLVIVGPEGPLVGGLADMLDRHGIAVFGPSSEAAQLEGSKAFMKDFVSRHKIPTAAYGRFTDADEAERFIRKTGAPIVVKADGLAAGKGVIIALSVEEAITATREMLSGVAFGAAGREVVIEEFLDGEELSYFVIADGRTFVPLTSAQDHKRVGDGDTGLNTGGMGAYSPAHLMTPEMEQKILDRMIRPTIDGMMRENNPFKGVLFAGIMVVKGEPILLEYNTRFGDPECQTILSRLDYDLVTLLDAAARGKLDTIRDQVKWKDAVALCVVMAAEGYPGTPRKDTVIRGIDLADTVEGVKVFHAGTARNEKGEIVAAGGRVLGVTAYAKDVATARANAYQAVDLLNWPEGFCRRDIAWRALSAPGLKKGL